MEIGFDREQSCKIRTNKRVSFKYECNNKSSLLLASLLILGQIFILLKAAGNKVKKIVVIKSKT
jgi:hypothetical protein